MAAFPGRKYLHKNALDRPSQVLNKLEFKFISHDFALSFKEKEKSLNQMASLETPFIFIASHFSKKEAICVSEFSKGTLQIGLVKRGR